MNTDIIKSNNLIAEFLGFKNTTPTDKDFNIYVNDDGEMLESMSMKYYISWDWLMPVVEKIEEFNKGNTTVNISDENCQISTQESSVLNKLYFDFYSSSHSKIDATYQAVIKFINWYNTIKK